MQVQNGGRAASVNMEAGKHGAAHVRDWFAREGRAPVTASLGHDPLLLVVAGTEVPRRRLRARVRRRGDGSARSTSSRGEVTGLPSRPSARSSSRAGCTPDRREPEGPFGEWTGYYSGGSEPVLTMDIERIYHRDDPILLGAPPGKPPHDYSYMRSVMKSAMIHDALVAHRAARAWRACGRTRPAAAASCSPSPSPAVRRGTRARPGTSPRSCPSAAYMNKFVVVVDADVDPRSLNDVMWAVCTRTDPGEDIEIMRRTWGSRVDPLREPGAPAVQHPRRHRRVPPLDPPGGFPRASPRRRGPARPGGAALARRSGWDPVT